MTNGPAPFDKQEYWSQRFQHEETFEWLMPWSVLESPLRTLNLLPLDPTARILNLGCGNSDLPLDLYRSGHHHVTSVDFVASVIDRMKERCERAIGWQPPAPTHGTDPAPVPTAECPLQFLEMDCLDMSRLPTQSFQLCIDKSTSDAISCGDDDEYTKLRTLCDQVARVIQPGGTWCVVSYSRFRQYEWTEGLGQGLWRTEQILEIKVEQNQDKEAEATGHVVYVPDVFQYLYVNRRL